MKDIARSARGRAVLHRYIIIERYRAAIFVQMPDIGDKNTFMYVVFRNVEPPPLGFISCDALWKLEAM